MIPRRIVWHHSAADTPDPQFHAINGWHKDRGFPISSLGFYVGYHYVIEKDGTVARARTDQEIGAHDTGENIDSLGICLVGNFSVSVPTVQQAFAFANLLRQLMMAHVISINAIEPHRRDDKTECPGTLMPDNWPMGLL